MADDLGTIGRRIYWCRNVLLADMDTIAFELSYGRGSPFTMDGNRLQPSQSEFGLRVASTLGRRFTFPAGTVSRWEADKGCPDLATIQGIATLCRADPGWLAFGAASTATSPIDSLSRAGKAYGKAVAKMRDKHLQRNEEKNADNAKATASLVRAVAELNRHKKSGK